MRLERKLTTLEEVKEFITNEKHMIEYYLELETGNTEKPPIKIALPEQIRKQILNYSQSLDYKDPIKIRYLHFQFNSLIHELNEVWVYYKYYNAQNEDKYLRIAPIDSEKIMESM